MRPMLAATLEPTNIPKLRYPFFASRKIDGIRCLVLNGQPVSRTLKPIPNAYIRESLAEMFAFVAEGYLLDGELISGSSFQDSTSNIMTRGGKPDFIYCVFDMAKISEPNMPYTERLPMLQSTIDMMSDAHKPRIRLLEQRIIPNQQELEAYEQEALNDGEEGIMLRAPRSPYKFGRSTEREAFLLKLKRFTSCEVTVVGYEQKFRNMNEAVVNELGLTERSTHKENQVPLQELGAFVVKTADGLVFSVGSGYTQAQREEFWKQKDALIGKAITVKYFDFNIKDKPRFPVFAGFRHPEDM